MSKFDFMFNSSSNKLKLGISFDEFVLLILWILFVEDVLLLSVFEEILDFLSSINWSKGIFLLLLKFMHILMIKMISIYIKSEILIFE